MSASTPSGGHNVPDDPKVLGSNLRLGARVFASGVIFVFGALVFAFLYLRAVNSNDLFRPSHVNPPAGFGIAILVGVLAATASFELGRRRLRSGEQKGWMMGSAVALGLAVAVAALQVIEYFALGFKTASGGYASVFFGWTLLFLLFWLGVVYWIETLVAQTARGGGAELLDSGADGCFVYLATMAVVQLVGFVLLYLVK